MLIENTALPYQQKNFSERLNDTSLWILKAEELLTAAALIRPAIDFKWERVKIKKGIAIDFFEDPDVQGVYFLLVAYAIENLCKAILVQRKRGILKNRLLKRVPKEIKGHNLLGLVGSIGLQLTVTTEELLVRLARNSIWAARYPVPIESDWLTSYEKNSNGKQVFSAYFTPEDMNKLDRFVDRLKNFLKIELR